MPSLLALDFSFNYATTVTSILPSLIALQSLKTLWLAGNPCSLQRGYRTLIAEDCRSVDIVDGMRVRKDETEELSSQTKNFNDLMNNLFKEDREKAAAKAEAEKNTKKGPVKDDKTKKDDKLKKDEKPAATRAQLDKKDPPKLQTMGSMELGANQLSYFEMSPEITNPFKVYMSIRTLEKINTVYFDDLADDPSFKREDVQACFWIEFDLSKPD